MCCLFVLYFGSVGYVVSLERGGLHSPDHCLFSVLRVRLLARLVNVFRLIGMLKSFYDHIRPALFECSSLPLSGTRRRLDAGRVSCGPADLSALLIPPISVLGRLLKFSCRCH